MKEEKYKNIIVDAIRFIVNDGKSTVFAFVIMSNHLHIIWQSKGSNNIKKIQNSFIKHTSKEFKKQLDKEGNLKDYEVNVIDRKYNFWQRDSLNIELFTVAVFNQKMEYIHYNPVKAGLCINPEDYYYSSAIFYYDGKDNFEMLSNYSGN